MTRTVADTYDSLPTEERTRACIFTSNYGEASALNFLDGHYGLPPAISGHNNYHLWGPNGCTGEVMVIVGIPRGVVEQVYADVKRAATVTCQYCVSEESDVAVYVATRPEVSIRDLWPQTKHFE
jgi:hypothetical protein